MIIVSMFLLSVIFGYLFTLFDKYKKGEEEPKQATLNVRKIGKMVLSGTGSVLIGHILCITL